MPRGTTERSEAGRVSPGGSATSASAPDAADGRRRAVPAYSRPRDGRPTTGTAVGRTSPPDRGDNGSWYYYDPYYRYSYYYNRYPYGYYWPGYGLGVGYFYDPWLFGSYGASDPYYYGGSGGYYSRDQYRDAGSLRLKVRPNHGQVFVDGYYAGEVDSFDGVFQKLTLDAGAHRIEIRAEGYETVQFEVMVTPGETVTYKGDLKRVQ